MQSDRPDLSGLSKTLSPLLPVRPAKVLLAGWPEPAPVDRERFAVVSSAEGGDLSAEARFDAAVCFLDTGTRGLPESIEARLGTLDVVVVVALLERPCGNLPPSGELGLRRAIAVLSEAGFSIRRDRELTTGGHLVKVLAARRDGFRIRRYREGDEDAILDLFTSAFHGARSPEHWRWKYLENPYDNRLISMAFAPEGELASHYAGYAVPFWIADRPGGRDFLGLQMGDTMTHPGFRDVGRAGTSLLARTVRHFFALHRDGRYGLYYGFNTGPIQRFCRWFIGGSQLDPVPYWCLEPAAEGASPLKRGPGAEQVERVGPAWDRFFRRVAPSYGFLARRDARYLEWRYLRCPDRAHLVFAARRFGRLVGWSVFRRRDDRLIWGDALFAPRHAATAARALLAAALAAPELAGVRRVEGWFSEHPGWWAKELRELGFVRRPEPDDLAFMFLPDREVDAASELRSLYYTMGDGDLF